MVTLEEVQIDRAPRHAKHVSWQVRNLRQGAGPPVILDRRIGEALASKYAEGPATPELAEQLRASGCEPDKSGTSAQEGRRKPMSG